MIGCPAVVPKPYDTHREPNRNCFSVIKTCLMNEIRLRIAPMAHWHAVISIWTANAVVIRSLRFCNER